VGDASLEDDRVHSRIEATLNSASLTYQAYDGPSTRTSTASGSRAWAMGLSVSMILIVCIRFFSEDLRIVPPLVQYIDVPITLVVAFCALLGFVGRGYRIGTPRLGLVLFLFILVSLFSAWINSSRVQWLPLAMFIFNFAAPLMFALATIQARLDRQDINRVLRTFLWLGVLQVGVGLLYGLPRFLATNNPDYVSGTFGQNAYQFTYFIGLWLLYILGGAVSGAQSGRRWRTVAVVLSAVAVFGLFYAAQYRAMLIFFTVVILISLWVSPARVSSRVLLSIALLTVSVISLIVVATSFPNLKLLKVFDLFEDSSPIVESGKIQAARNVTTMYEEIPHAALVGSGPATFTSRAYLTFSSKPRAEKEAVGVLAVQLIGGQYSTDVARKYVDTIAATPIQGGTTASSPRSSFTSLAAEVGSVGLLVYMSAYLMALMYSFRQLRASAKNGDAVGSQLAFTCFGGTILLLVQTLFDNWLETTRVAIPLWTLIGLLYAREFLKPDQESRAQHETLEDGHTA
jgi:hypothetical protein